MAVHIFAVSKENYDICVDRGLVAIPGPKDSRNQDIVFDALSSRLSGINEDDYILMYVLKPYKLLRGVWQVEGRPFYEETPVWSNGVYPFRCRFKWSKYNFQNALKLDDINDLRNAGKIWTWALERATGTNSAFSISNSEFNTLLTEFMKINPFSTEKGIIQRPYQYRAFNLIEKLHIQNQTPKFESTLMALLSLEFARGSYREIFGNYTDFLSYVPTNLGTEMDFLLMYNNPVESSQVVSYDIIELKRDKFDEKALKQLIGYESWFLQKKVFGDLNMVRTTAIAKSYSGDVIDYVKKRTNLENKPIKLLQYAYENAQLSLSNVLDS